MVVPYRQRNTVEQRRAEVDRIDSMTVKVTAVSGRILVRGVGELSHELNFPVWFTEVPIMSFGGELYENQFPQAGKYPTMSCVVLKWIIDLRDREASAGYYRGATLGLSLTGKADQLMYVHWTATGKAIRNPVNDIDTLESTI